MDRIRIDKWLWAARFFKTRSLAARACGLGRIEWNGREAKPAHDVHAGDMLRIRNSAGEFEVEVLGLSESRGPATIACALYRETDASRAAREKLAAERKAMPPPQPLRNGRPSKRNRREMDRLRGRL